MSPENTPLDPELERALSEIREEAVDPAVVKAAGERVWAKLSAEIQPPAVEHIRTCADFQALIPELRAGRLPAARALLVRDHIHECVACRRVYEGKVVAFPGGAGLATRRSLPVWRWAAAAALVVGVGFGAWRWYEGQGYGGLAAVQTVNGTLYRVAAGGMVPMTAGQEVPDGIEIRTAKDSGAMVQLHDGSVVEMRERSGFTTSQSGRDLTLRLSQGGVIVQAAKRRSGHLYVTTADARVAVTGTVFGVSAGVKGTRVSVVEGEVRVTQQNGEKVLHPGDQTTSSTALSPVRVQDDIAWSRNIDRHLALLKAMQALQKSLDQVKLPDLRYSSRILDRMPANTVLYASIPNLGQYLAEAQDVFRQRIAASPELQSWMQQGSRGANFGAMLGHLRDVSAYLGDEIVVAAVADAEGKMHGPVFLTEERKPGFNALLEAKGAPFRAASRNGMMAFSPEAQATELLLSAQGGFAGTPLYMRVADAYHNGAGLVFAADVTHGVGHSTEPMAGLGLSYFVAEQKQTAARTDVRATVGFRGPRQGVAAWLAAPAPMGTLQYVSQEATFVSAFVMKNPASIVDEMLAVTEPNGEKGHAQVAKMLPEIGVDLRNDLGASLGGEFALALDGPAFPVPSWKLVLEAYDANRVQFVLQKIVAAYNREQAKYGKPALRTAQEVVAGRTYYLLAGGDPNPLTEMHYTFADGYLVAAPSRALVDKALQVRVNGLGIARSSAFLALLPRDRYANFSGMIYQNLGSTLAPLVGLFGGMAKMSPEGEKMLHDVSNLKATLITIYGETDRIEIAGTGDQFKLPVAQILTGNLSGLAGGVLPFGGGFAHRGEHAGRNLRRKN
jgi:hypothetical protein